MYRGLPIDWISTRPLDYWFEISNKHNYLDDTVDGYDTVEANLDVSE